MNELKRKTLMCALLLSVNVNDVLAQDWGQICDDLLGSMTYNAECLQYKLTGSVSSQPQRTGSGPESVSASRPTPYQGNGDAPCAGSIEACGGTREQRQPSDEIRDQQAYELKIKRDELVTIFYKLQEDRSVESYYQNWAAVDEIDYQIRQAHEDISEIDYQLNTLRSPGW